jgi:hypothetical protein
MAKTFDLAKQRETLVTFDFQYNFKQQLEDVREKGTLGSRGVHMITTAVDALVCGFKKEAMELLQKAETFLEQSLAQIDREVVHQVGGKYNVYFGYALVRGMTTGAVDSANFAHAFRVLKEDAREELRTDREVHPLSLAAYMKFAWFARACDEAMMMYETVFPNRTGDSGNLSIKTISDLVYELCRQRKGSSTSSQQQLSQAQAKFLDSNIEPALAQGLARDAYAWCKIAYPDADRDQLIEKLVSHVPSIRARSQGS